MCVLGKIDYVIIFRVRFGYRSLKGEGQRTVAYVTVMWAWCMCDIQFCIQLTIITVRYVTAEFDTCC